MSLRAHAFFTAFRMTNEFCNAFNAFSLNRDEVEVMVVPKRRFPVAAVCAIKKTGGVFCTPPAPHNIPSKIKILSMNESVYAVASWADAAALPRLAFASSTEL